MASREPRLDCRAPLFDRLWFVLFSQMIVLVITSYSIHYTKLYDAVVGLSVAAEVHGAVVAAGVEVVGVAVVALLAGLDLMVAAVRAVHAAEVAAGGRISRRRFTAGAAATTIAAATPLRITSYNVCYTKLLRSVDEACTGEDDLP